MPDFSPTELAVPGFVALVLVEMVWAWRKRREAYEPRDTLTSLAFGPMDLSASLGHRGQPGHPDVLAAVRQVIDRARQAGVPTGVSIGSSPAQVLQWVELGVDWIAFGADVTLMIQSFQDVAAQARDHASASGGAD